MEFLPKLDDLLLEFEDSWEDSINWILFKELDKEMWHRFTDNSPIGPLEDFLRGP